MSQICKNCQIEKPVSDFQFRSDTGRYRKVCKACISLRRHEIYLTTSDKVIARVKKWRSENPERVKEQGRRSSLKHKAAKNETSRKWAADNKELAKARATEWRKQNAERARATAKALRELNPEKFRSVVRNRRAKLKSSGKHSASDVSRLILLQKGLCNGCRCDLDKSGYHVDHIVAVANGGSNGPENLQILCPTCNISKGVKDMTQWRLLKGY